MSALARSRPGRGRATVMALAFLPALAAAEVGAQTPSDTTLTRAFAAYRQADRPGAEALLVRATLRSRGDSALAALLRGMIAWSGGDDRAARGRFYHVAALDSTVRLDAYEPDAMQRVFAQARQDRIDYVRDSAAGGGARTRPPAFADDRVSACSGRIRTGRAAAIGGAFVGGWAVAIAMRPDEWWQGPVQGFKLNWAEGPSPAANMDFLLHVGASYQASQAAMLAWRWACASPTASVWLGAATAFAVGLPKKVVDGFHNTGFELKKNLGNAIGAFLPVVHAQWPVTRTVALKGFYFPSDEYRNRNSRTDFVGRPSSPITDYTGQHWFASINPSRGGIAPAWWPAWLGVAVGHGTTPWITEWPGTHVWYGTLDIEFRGLPVRAPWWRPVATLLDQAHFPSPGVKLERGSVSFGLF